MMKTATILLGMIIGAPVIAQTREPHHTVLEFSAGKNIYQSHLKRMDVRGLMSGSSVFGIGFNKVTKYKNLHKLHYMYTEERNLSPVINSRLQYAFEKTLSRGKYGRGFLGVSFGGGVGYESYDNEKYVKKSNLYPFGMVGINYEFFITRKISLAVKDEGSFSFLPITNNLQNQLCVGVKFKLNKSKSI